MEPTQQNQQPNDDTNCGNYGGGGAKGSFLCRQSSARWTPTTEQIRILKDLYYNNGVRSPSADQIQRISARLRQYGKIEGKNVFYWFQNHKARERQKKRFISDHLVSLSPTATTYHHRQQQQPSDGTNNSTVASSAAPPASANWKPDQHYKNKFPGNFTAATPITTAASSSSAGVLGIGSYGYEPMTVENCFRDCSISPKAKLTTTTGESRSHNYGCIGGNISNYYEHETEPTLHDEDQEEEEQGAEEEEEEAAACCGLETLPLFPMHHEDCFNGGYSNNDINSLKNSSSTANYYFSNGGSYTSLELSLNSFFGRSTD